MKRRGFLLAAVATFVASSMPALAQDTLAAIRSAGKIRVAIEFGRPPWGFKDENLKPTGSDYETAELLAKDLGVSLDVVEVTGPNRVPFLVSNHADMVISTFSITPERQKVINFSVPYASAVQYVAAPKSFDLKGEQDLKDKRVGVTRGTIGESVLSKLEVPGLEVVRFDDESTNMTALASGQVDIVVQEPAVISRVAAQKPAKEIEPKFTIAEFAVGVGMRKNDPALKSYVDSWVRTNLANGKLNDIYQNYHGVPLSEKIREAK